MRVTESHLSAIVARINRMQGTPLAPYARGDDGHVRACIGSYHLDHAYGGVALYQIQNDGGGVRDVLRIGHVSKRELQSAMFAYITGLEDAPRAPEA